MKRFYAFLAIIFLSIFIQAQPQDNTNTSIKQSDNVLKDDENKTTSGGKSKFNLPAEKKNPVNVPFVAAPPAIDGKLDDEIWKSAAVFKDFYQTAPGDNIEPSKPTEAYLAYDEKNLYIAFKCWDEPGKIRATVAKRDNVFGEDNVRIWLDTYNDQRRAYVLGWNPLGIQQDGIYTEGSGNDFSVDIVMESKGVIEEWGWSVEVKIPFKSLRYSAGKNKFWGFNAARNIDRLNDEFDSWMPDDRNISGQLIKYGKIGGLDEIKTERTLEIVPSITVSETGNRVRSVPRYLVNQFGYFDPVFNQNGLIENGRFVNKPIGTEIGVNLKYSITPNITLDAAVNPDYAEIEADAPVVTANQRFPIFFQEKRPFFLEGADIFSSPLQVFYSRTIVDPDIAAKLTGKIGRTSFGFLVASDNAPGNYEEDDRNDPSIRPRIDEFLGKNATFGVLRLKRDNGRENSIGFFGTYRSFPEQHNILGGFDGRFKLTPQMTSQFQIVGTNSRRCLFNNEFEPTLNPFQAQRNRELCGGSTFNRYRTGNGFGYTYSLDYTEKNRGFYFEANGRTKDYRADAGFTRRTNTNRMFLAGRLSTEPRPKSSIIRFNWRPSVSTSFDWQGRSQGLGFSSNYSFEFQRNTSANIQTGVYYERIFEGEFGLKRSFSRNGAFFGESERSTWQQSVSVNVESSPSKQLSFGGFIGFINNAFDFDFGGGNRFPRVSPLFLTYQTAYDEYVRRFLINPNDPLNIRPNFPSQNDPGTGLQYDIGAYGEYKPIDPFRISLEYKKSNLKRDDTGQTAFDSNIFTLRSTYQFTRFLYTRLRVDYSSLSSNASGQFLVGYNPSPGTAFYVGYNDNFNYNGFNPFTGQLEPRFERNSRTFFIRASYLFRKSF
ncbi:hypothetical protein BH20ACI1_BH20ACI1_05610 [soil metagenome]